MIRKHSIRQYETLDVQISATADAEDGETQSEVTERIYKRLKVDIIRISKEMRQLAKDREF